MNNLGWITEPNPFHVCIENTVYQWIFEWKLTGDQFDADRCAFASFRTNTEWVGNDAGGTSVDATSWPNNSNFKWLQETVNCIMSQIGTSFINFSTQQCESYSLTIWNNSIFIQKIDNIRTEITPKWVFNFKSISRTHKYYADYAGLSHINFDAPINKIGGSQVKKKKDWF